MAQRNLLSSDTRSTKLTNVVLGFAAVVTFPLWGAIVCMRFVLAFLEGCGECARDKVGKLMEFRNAR